MLPILFAALTTLSLTAAQDEEPGKELAESDIIDPANLTSVDLTESTDAFVTAVANTQLAVEEEDDKAERVEVEIEISTEVNYLEVTALIGGTLGGIAGLGEIADLIPKGGRALLPRNGRALKLDEQYDGLMLLNISFSSGPCAMAYEDGSGDEVVKREKKFGEEGGWFAPNASTLNYIYCGNEEDFQAPGSDAEVCEDTFKGDLARDTLDVCCKMPTQWDAKLWDDHDMDSYLKKSLEHWNENGWPASVIRTFAEYDQTEFKRADEMEPEQPMWQWNCEGIHSDRCQVRDLSYRNACLQDPKRVLLLQALENFGAMWQTARTVFDEQVMTDITMTIPNISKALHPNVVQKEFDAPGDYNDATWTMIGGGIAGLLAIPFSFGPLALPAGAIAGVIGGIMWQVGLALGPLLSHFVEEDPHFEQFGDFSEAVGKDLAKKSYQAYQEVYNSFFMKEPPSDEGMNTTTIVNMFKGGSLIRPVSADSLPEVKDPMANALLSPVVNLAWQRQRMFIVKMPKGGFEIWRHKPDDDTDTMRTSVVYDPCGDHDGQVQWRPSFTTAEKDYDPEGWEDLPNNFGRHYCSGDTGYMMLSWDKDGEKAWADFGWEEVVRRGMKMETIITMSEEHQKGAGYNHHAENLEERLTEMVAKAEFLDNDPDVFQFWNLPVCDLTDVSEEGPGLMRMEDCNLKTYKDGAFSRKRMDEYKCSSWAIRDRCLGQKVGGEDWPFDIEV